MADQMCAMQISMPSKQSWMPPIDTRRSSMIAMTELPAAEKSSGRGRGQAGME